MLARPLPLCPFLQAVVSNMDAFLDEFGGDKLPDAYAASKATASHGRFPQALLGQWPPASERWIVQSADAEQPPPPGYAEFWSEQLGNLEQGQMQQGGGSSGSGGANPKSPPAIPGSRRPTTPPRKQARHAPIAKSSAAEPAPLMQLQPKTCQPPPPPPRQTAQPEATTTAEPAESSAQKKRPPRSEQWRARGGTYAKWNTVFYATIRSGASADQAAAVADKAWPKQPR